MYRYKEILSICLFALVGCALTKRCKVQNEYRMNVSKQLCRPCSRSSISSLGTLEFDGGVCPNVTNVTQVFVKQLEESMRTVAANLERDGFKFTRELKADDTFVPMTIKDLKSLNQSGITTYLKTSTKPEEIIHKIYARTILLSAYIELSRCMLGDLKTLTTEPRQEIQRNLISLEHQLLRISCKLYAFTELLGVSQIKKKVCKYAKRIKGLDSTRDETDFILTVLKAGAAYANKSVKELNELPTLIMQCEYKRCNEGKMKLSCNGDENTDGNGRSRNPRNDKKNRHSKKNKGRKGNRKRDRKNKRDKKCKNKGSSKDQSKPNKRCRRQRNKNKQNKPISED